MIGMEISIGDWVYIKKHPNMCRVACVEGIEAVNPDGTLLLTLAGPNLCTDAGIPDKTCGGVNQNIVMIPRITVSAQC